MTLHAPHLPQFGRPQHVQWQTFAVSRDARASLLGQAPCVIWFTGLSGAGKSTIANLVDLRLYAAGRKTYVLDGDNVRHGLTRDLGFSPADRTENIRRVSEVARMMTDAGLIVLASFISPLRSERRIARDIIGQDFLEVFVDAPLEIAEARDPKGLYKRARRGEIRHFTGVDAPYETPDQPDLRIDTTLSTPDEAANLVIDALLGVHT